MQFGQAAPIRTSSLPGGDEESPSPGHSASGHHKGGCRGLEFSVHPGSSELDPAQLRLPGTLPATPAESTGFPLRARRLKTKAVLEIPPARSRNSTRSSSVLRRLPLTMRKHSRGFPSGLPDWIPRRDRRFADPSSECHFTQYLRDTKIAEIAVSVRSVSLRCYLSFLSDQNRLSGRLRLPKLPIPLSVNEKLNRVSVRTPKEYCWNSIANPQQSHM